MSSKVGNNPTTLSPEISKIDHGGAKPKATIPLRVLDEEVWLSGSELKTDNDSSDEEKGQLRKSTKNEVKKGARKKIKPFSNSSTKTVKHIKMETKVEKVEDTEAIETLSSCSETSSETEEFLDVKEFSVENEFLKILEENSLNEYSNQADDEKTQLQEINFLEERIRKAEREYMDARMDTDKLVEQMINILNSVKDFQEPEWKYFIEITKKWVNCLTKGTSTLKFQAELSYSHSCDGNMNKKPKKRALRKMCSKNTFFANKHTKQNIKNKSENSPKTQRNSLDVVLKTIGNQSKENTYYEPYKLTSDELDRISKIDDQLASYKSCSSLEIFNYYQINKSEENQDLENPTNMPLTDSEKLQIYYSPQPENDPDINENNEIESNLERNDELFDSCDEFASSRRC